MSNQKYEAFLKVAETGSFKEAARELGYTQAGISYLINALEREFDVVLFARDYGGAHPTAEGKNLLPLVQDICNAERRLGTLLSDLKHLEGGSLRVATFTSTAIQWMPGIAKDFEQLYPAIELDIVCSDDQHEVEDMVRQGTVDCGFVVRPVKQDLYLISLVCDPLLVVVACDHPLAHKKHFPIEALSREPFVKLESGVHSEMDELFRRNDVEPRPRFTISSDYAVMSLVSAGLGYSVLPALILRNAPFPLASLPPEVPTNREIALCVRSLETASTATKAFLEVAQAWVGRSYGKEKTLLAEGSA